MPKASGYTWSMVEKSQTTLRDLERLELWLRLRLFTDLRCAVLRYQADRHPLHDARPAPQHVVQYDIRSAYPSAFKTLEHKIKNL